MEHDMKISNRTKLPEWIVVWARQVPVFADLIRSHLEVAERMHAIIRFREAKIQLSVAQAARAVGTHCRRCTSGKAVWTVIRPASRRRKTTATNGADAGGAGGDQAHAQLLRLGQREALEHPAQGRPSDIHGQHPARGAGIAGEQRDQVDPLPQGHRCTQVA